MLTMQIASAFLVAAPRPPCQGATAALPFAGQGDWGMFGKCSPGEGFGVFFRKVLAPGPQGQERC